MSAVIDAKALTKVYRRGREEIHALKNVDFQVAKGEFVSIIGPSGSGKTALLNVLGCLDTPSGGSLRLNGTETKGLKESELVRLRRDNIGFVFQQFYLMPTLQRAKTSSFPCSLATSIRMRARTGSMRSCRWWASPIEEIICPASSLEARCSVWP
jgi:putative ABC transport system ATP-binding protein